MGTEQDKLKHSTRIQRTMNYIKTQTKLRATMYKLTELQPHRYHKRSFSTCGDSNCMMCMNPRKRNGELTIQEQGLFQPQLHEE